MKRLKLDPCRVTTLAFLTLMLLHMHPAAAQERQRILVIPFNPINISRDDTELIDAAFTAALIRTDAFLVIDRNETDAALEALEYSLLECTDRQCAVVVGERLAAEQVILGSLASGDEAVVLKAKSIEVSSGKTTFMQLLRQRLDRFL